MCCIWNGGLAYPHPTMLLAAPIAARITLRNPSRAYSPEVTAGYAPGQRIRILSDDGLTLRTHFTGRITRIEPMAGDQGQRLAVIYAGGPEADLSNHIRLPPQVNQPADQVIAAVLDALPLRQPTLAGYWLLDITDHMQLDTTTRLAEQYPRALEIGQSIFAYTADTWAEGIPALTAIRQMVEAEDGRFLVDREGAFIFYNRHHTILDTAPVATFTDDMDGLDYTYGADIGNRVRCDPAPAQHRRARNNPVDAGKSAAHPSRRGWRPPHHRPIPRCCRTSPRRIIRYAAISWS